METDATKTVKLLKLPPMLVVHLGRFAYDAAGACNVKSRSGNPRVLQLTCISTSRRFQAAENKQYNTRR